MPMLGIFSSLWFANEELVEMLVHRGDGLSEH